MSLILASAAQPDWFIWNFNIVLVAGLVAVTAAYIVATGPLRKRFAPDAQLTPGRAIAFHTGTAVLALALVSPLDTLGDSYLFSAHMVQHMLIALITPPLWLLGLPAWLVDPLFARVRVRQISRWLTHPFVAFGLFNANLWLWHLPPLYDATLASDSVHIFEHVTFIATGIVFWWPVLSPTRYLPRISYGLAILYLFAACQPMVALGAIFTFAAAPFYQPYVNAPHLWGTTALGDQQLGGLIMWLPSTIPYLVALSICFFRWIGVQDRAERAAAGEYDAPFESDSGEKPSIASSTP